MKESSKSNKKSKIRYIQPRMRFNAGTMSYEPVLPKSKQSVDKRMSKVEKINAWAVITLIIMLILLLLLAIQVFF